jgi:hypothetical protein
VPVTITGSSLNTDVAVNAGPGVTVSNVNVVNSTQITATLTISKPCEKTQPSCGFLEGDSPPREKPLEKMRMPF